MNPLIVALDTRDVERALALARVLEGAVAYVKVGSQLFLAGGVELLRTLKTFNIPIFLDLKFHDIPSQVGAACEEAAAAGVEMLTLHVSGGISMLEEAVKGLKRAQALPGSAKTLLIGVTHLTSLSSENVEEIYGRRFDESLARQVSMTEQSGLDGFVASAHEIGLIRRLTRRRMLIITPGIRPKGTARADQKRVVEPETALRLGADYIVMGRPIIDAPDPRAAAEHIVTAI